MFKTGFSQYLSIGYKTGFHRFSHILGVSTANAVAPRLPIIRGKNFTCLLLLYLDNKETIKKTFKNVQEWQVILNLCLGINVRIVKGHSTM